MGKLVPLTLVAALAGCALGDAETPRPRVEARACYESFHAVLEGWEMLLGPVPEPCRRLDEAYAVTVTSGPMPCTSSDPGRVVGCHMPPSDIYVAEHLSEADRVDVSVHEWTHALSLCVRGDAGSEHLDRVVWGDDPHDHVVGIAPDNVRSYGIVTSALGPCVE